MVLTRARTVVLYGVTAGIFALAAVVAAGYFLTAPHPGGAGPLPDDLPGRSVTFSGAGGATLAGWFVPSAKPAGTLILMHGVHASRFNMLERARFLNRAGFSILLYDSRGHGESSGAITFGYLESQDAQSAVRLARELEPNQRIGIIGVSMGGAAAVLADPPLPVEALVLESVYPTVDQAITNRIKMRLGSWGGWLTPLLTIQFRPRLGVRSDQLRPVDHVGRITAPKLFIAGKEDRQTPLDESMQIFDRAADPKEMWIIEGTAHADFYEHADKEYEDRVLRFLTRYVLKSP